MAYHANDKPPKEMEHILLHHLVALRQDFRCRWPTLDHEMVLIHFLCDRQQLAHPKPLPLSTESAWEGWPSPRADRADNGKSGKSGKSYGVPDGCCHGAFDHGRGKAGGRDGGWPGAKSAAKGKVKGALSWVPPPPPAPVGSCGKGGGNRGQRGSSDVGCLSYGLSGGKDRKRLLGKDSGKGASEFSDEVVLAIREFIEVAGGLVDLDAVNAQFAVNGDQLEAAGFGIQTNEQEGFTTVSLQAAQRTKKRRGAKQGTPCQPMDLTQIEKIVEYLHASCDNHSLEFVGARFGARRAQLEDAGFILTRCAKTPCGWVISPPPGYSAPDDGELKDDLYEDMFVRIARLLDASGGHKPLILVLARFGVKKQQLLDMGFVFGPAGPDSEYSVFPPDAAIDGEAPLEQVQILKITDFLKAAGGSVKVNVAGAKFGLKRTQFQAAGFLIVFSGDGKESLALP